MLRLDPSASPADVLFAINSPGRGRDQEGVYCISVCLRERGGYRRSGNVVKIVEGRSEEGWEDAMGIFMGRVRTWLDLEGVGVSRMEIKRMGENWGKSG
jgi:hypothetical protein